MAKADIDRRVADVAEMLELTELLRRKPAQLSGGQRQRVAMGRALIREPVAFLLDEPLSNLDAKLRAELRAELKRLHARLETTMIFVTHDQVEAMTLGDRIAVMDRGRLQQVGTPEDIYRTPRNIFVARFVGSPAMNLLPGPAVGQADGVVVGIRPELLQPVGDPPGGITLDVLAEVVEPLGSDVFVHGVTGAGDAVVARLAGDARLSPGERVALSAPAGQVHLFDEVSGERIA
jgi:ABC-type sugar transport system ATPase subunit